MKAIYDKIKAMDLHEYCINTGISVIVVIMLFCIVMPQVVSARKEAQAEVEYLESLYEISELTLDNYSDILSIYVSTITSEDSFVTANASKMLTVYSKCNVKDLIIEYCYNLADGSTLSAINTLTQSSILEGTSYNNIIESSAYSWKIIGVTVISISGRVSK